VKVKFAIVSSPYPPWKSVIRKGETTKKNSALLEWLSEKPGEILFPTCPQGGRKRGREWRERRSARDATKRGLQS